MSVVFRAILPVTAICLTVAPALSQDDPRAQRIRQETLNAAPATAPLRSAITAGFLLASTSETTATASTGFRLIDGGADVDFRLEATAPLQKGEATLGNFQGLGDGTEITLSIVGGIWPGTRPLNPREIAAIQQWCRTIKGNAGKAGRDDPIKKVPDDCNTINTSDLDDASDELYQQYMARSNWKEPQVFDFGVGIGRASYDYLESGDLSVASMDRLAYSIGGNVGTFFTFLPGFLSAMVSVGGKYELDYTPSPESEVCSPLGSGGALRCRTASIGAPTRSEGFVANGQLRGFVSRQFAVNPQVRFSFADESWSATIPLYFLPSADHSLIGGIAPFYQSEGSDWGIRVFVGKVFNLTP